MPTRSSWTISLIYSPLRNPSNGMFLRCSEQKVEPKLTNVTLRGDANRRLHARTLSRSARDFIPTTSRETIPPRTPFVDRERSRGACPPSLTCPFLARKIRWR